MSWLPKKFPAPVAKPYAPFFIAGYTIDPETMPGQLEELKRCEGRRLMRDIGLVVMYGVNSFQTMMMNTDEFKNDPRNPNAGKPTEKH
ncbi:hypothetical protein HYFRA_00007191 [Hymenoscyphus fraxineus]|uniref:Uncharacterized protein n=1 Tax=Hymenoscyphus fraxineus TaxID=746836 RepID=A0A9N9PTG3_9HELO|nr:hypothetical protein HYFRA_00007191 [Hymenoscyphus fraxineus]